MMSAVIRMLQAVHRICSVTQQFDGQTMWQRKDGCEKVRFTHVHELTQTAGVGVKEQLS